MLGKRTLSAVFIVLIFGVLIHYGDLVYTIGIGLILAAAAQEFTEMFKHRDFHTNSALIATETFSLMIIRYYTGDSLFTLCIVFAIFITCAAAIYQYKNDQKRAAINLAINIAGLGFIALPGSYLILIRNLQNGNFLILLCMLTAALADVGAYLLGSAFGKHKLSPLVSPNKSIEGYFGGILFAGITAAVVQSAAALYQINIDFFAALTVGLTIGIVAPLGDLSKSVIKRTFSIKDTGHLIPGHGGILDRIDTILWAAPITYFLIIFLA